MSILRVVMLGGPQGLRERLQLVLSLRSRSDVEIVQIVEGESSATGDAPRHVVMVDAEHLVDVRACLTSHVDFSLLEPLREMGYDGYDRYTLRANRQAAQAEALARLRGNNRNGVPAHAPRVLRGNSSRGR